ncbi:hypothetical protein BJ742DRAFT_780371 [Cladochytrium replicatum]|nr:hypothetical protein BJ742DRAFT_780371 [Cladochytrium replicatum]
MYNTDRTYPSAGSPLDGGDINSNATQVPRPWFTAPVLTEGAAASTLSVSGGSREIIAICEKFQLSFAGTSRLGLYNSSPGNMPSAQLIMEQVTTSTVRALAVANTAVNMVTNNTGIIGVLTTTAEPVIVGNQTDTFRELVNALRTQPIHNGLICSATENFTGVINPKRRFFSSTPPPQIGVYIISGIPFVAFADDSTGWHYSLTPWNGSGPLGPPAFQSTPGYPPVGLNSSWVPSSFVDKGVVVWQFVHLGYHFPNDRDRALGVMPAFVCGLMIELQTSFSKFIEGISASFTNGTRIFLFEKISGLLVTSDNASAIAEGDIRFSASSTADLTISSLTSALLQRSIPDGSGDFVTHSILDVPTMTLSGFVAQGRSKLFLVRARLISDFEANWVAVVAIPYEGFFGVVDQLRMRTIIIAAVLGAVGLGLTLLLSYFTLTKLDFSVLEKKTLDGKNRSKITEITALQDTFITMVRAFAVYLKVNRAMTTGKYTTQDSQLNV